MDTVTRIVESEMTARGCIMRVIEIRYGVAEDSGVATGEDVGEGRRESAEPACPPDYHFPIISLQIFTLDDLLYGRSLCWL